MLVSNKVLADKLREILDLQAEIQSLETKCDLLLNADEPVETLNELRHKIKYLRVELKAKEDHAMTLFN